MPNNASQFASSDQLRAALEIIPHVQTNTIVLYNLALLIGNICSYALLLMNRALHKKNLELHVAWSGDYQHGVFSDESVLYIIAVAGVIGNRHNGPIWRRPTCARCCVSWSQYNNYHHQYW